jgi:O-antigen/teichoic acid export membrane protein
MPYVVRGLGPSRFGVLALAWAVLGYVSVFDLGLGRATTKFVAEVIEKGAHERVSAIVWTTVLTQLAMGVLGTLIMLSATSLLVDRVLNVPIALRRETTLSFYLLAFSIPSILITGSLRGVLEAAHRFDLVNAIRVPFSAAHFLLPLVGVLMQWHLPAIIGMLAISRALAVAVHYLLCCRVFPSLRGWPRFDSSELRGLIAFGGWVTVSSIAIPLLVYLDRFLIGSLHTLSAVTYYTAPYEAVSKLLFVPASFASVLFPTFSRLSAVGDQRAISATVARWTNYLVIVMTPIILMFVLFANGILRVWLGAGFAMESAGALRLLSVAVLLNSIGYIPFALVEGVGRPDLVAKYHIVELPFYAVVAYGLIARFGIDGAALAWCLRMAWTIPVFFALCVRIAGVPLKALSGAGTIRGLVVALTLVLGALGFVIWRVWPVPATIVAAAAFLGGFVLLVWHYVLDPLDRARILSAYARVRGATMPGGL